MIAEDFIKEFAPLQLKKTFAGVRLPKLKIDSKYYKELDLPESSSNTKFLQKLCKRGYYELEAKGKINPADKMKYSNRAFEEIKTFNKLNFVDYVLIVWDVINYCKEKGIPTGIGRGSVCGSLICYLIGVTGIDPLKYNLLFQRFVSEARAKSQIIDGELYIDGLLMCDIDIDIEHSRREEVMEYLNKKYPNRLAKIINLNTLTGKNLIKECGKVVAEKNEVEMNKISELVHRVFGKVQDIETMYKHNKEFTKWCDNNPEVYEIALKLRDLIKHKSVHASGLIMSYDKLEDICPLELTSQKEITSGFDMKDVMTFCIKLDILGLKTLTIVDEVCKLVNVKMEDIDFNNPIIYKFLQNFRYTYGIFQMEEEAGTAEKVTNIIKPNNLDELSDVLALARPGAMNYVKQYSENKARGYFDEIHLLFDPIFKSTQGLPLYQEQLMQMLHAIGFTLDEAEICRRIVGKKIREEVAVWEDKIKAKIKANNLPEQLGNLTWEVLSKSADYSFNRSHSIAYAALAAITIYLKVKYPKEFYLACLKVASTKADRSENILRISNEMKHFGIKLLPPSLIYSKEDFTSEKDGIRYGLSSIKSVSDVTLERLRKFNIEGCNKFELLEAAKQARINLGVLTAMIMAGALGNASEARSKLVLEAQVWNLLLPKEKAYCLKHGKEYDFDLMAMLSKLMSWVGDDGKPIARQSSKQTRLDTIKKRYEDYKNIYLQNSQYEDLANYFYEKNILGFTYSKSLKEIFLPACPYLMSIEEFRSKEDDFGKGTVVGIVDNITEGTSKTKKRYTKFTLNDGTGTLTALIFDEKDGQPGGRTALRTRGKLPKNEGEIAAFMGKKWNDVMILDDISPQTEKIYIKLADLKNN